MASTYLDLTCHVIFATKQRHAWIDNARRDRLHGHMGGTLRSLGVAPIAIGGTADHVHLLVGLRRTHALASVVRDLKTASSAWIKETCGFRPIAWQEGYAGLSVSGDRKSTVVAYIANQEEHHRKRSSKEEPASGGIALRLTPGLCSSRPYRG